MGDIAALVREIRISNERQERLLSLVQDTMKLKNRTTEGDLDISLKDQELANSNSAAKDVSDSLKMTQEEIEGVVDILLQGFGFSSANTSYLWKYWGNSPTLQIPDDGKLVKVRWGSNDNYDEDFMQKVRRSWRVAVKLPTNLFELGYDPSGYPMDWMSNEDTRYPHPFGIFGNLLASNDFLDVNNLATILSLLATPPDSSGDDGAAESLDDITAQSLIFVMAFSGSWTSIGDLGISCRPFMDYHSARKIVHIQHHVRVLRISNSTMDSLVNLRSENGFGVNCERMRGALGFHNSSFLIEWRASLALHTSSTLKLPVFSMVSVEDKLPGAIFPSVHFPLKPESWRAANLRIGRYYRGISIFQAALHKMLNLWFTRWTKTLEEVDHLVQVQPTDLLNEDEMSKLMFDDSLNKSRQYFVVLQMLRIIGEWISEALRDVEQQKNLWDQDRYSRKILNDEGKIVIAEQDLELEENVIGANWEVLVSFQQSQERLLLNRVDRKTEEVKSLRDGLFNATSVREAQKGTAINQYLFVFTVITIFYLPLSFVATVFGMHLFDYDDTHKTQTSFYISTALISVITYILSGFAAWWVGDSVRRQKLKKHWKDWTSGAANEQGGAGAVAPAADEDPGSATHGEKPKTSLWNGLRSRKNKQNEVEEALLQTPRST